MALLALPAVFLSFLLQPVHGGVGGSVVSLATCAAEKTYQQWQYTASKRFEIVVTSDALRLWGTTWCISTGTGIGELPVALNTPIFTSPCGSGLSLDATPDSPRTALALTDGSGLCVAAAAPQGALPGIVLTLATCVTPVPDSQAFSFSTATGSLVHSQTSLCVDSGTRFRGCVVGSPGTELPYCDAAVPVDARVADLISRLSFEEKVGMLSSASGGSPAFGVSPFQWWAESLHGVANNVGVAFDAPTPAATAFPQPITSACSFNRSLWLATGQAVSDEVRAFANAGHSGLTLWAPNIK
jgi:hypothetical protein